MLYYRVVKPTAPGTELEVWFWSQWNPSKCVTIFEYAHRQMMPWFIGLRIPTA